MSPFHAKHFEAELDEFTAQSRHRESFSDSIGRILAEADTSTMTGILAALSARVDGDPYPVALCREQERGACTLLFIRDVVRHVRTDLERLFMTGEQQPVVANDQDVMDAFDVLKADQNDQAHYEEFARKMAGYIASRQDDACRNLIGYLAGNVLENPKSAFQQFRGNITYLVSGADLHMTHLADRPMDNLLDENDHLVRLLALIYTGRTLPLFQQDLPEHLRTLWKHGLLELRTDNQAGYALTRWGKVVAKQCTLEGKYFGVEIE